ncbi:MBG domain-containing protein [Comamonas testosteroni]|uniref:MBG domain-containing protein n=2 Tax=Comamonas testosteroni TaxID=285 RepID=UPI002E14A395|nr:MBG domain-containing protein [Comamonas testosteroni]
MTADAASKVYGDVDDLKYTSSGLIHGDRLGGSLGRAAGENVGSYAINQGSLAHSNYSITFTGNQLQITPKALSVTADAASKVYGDADDLKYTSSGLIHGDSLGGSLGRAAGENVGSYAINQGSLANSNYSISFTGNQLQITPKVLSVTADAASKVYGDVDDLKYTSSGLIHGDRLGGSLGRAAGENVGSYAINQGSLAHSNYSISFTGNQLQITPKALSVTADAASKVYGDADDLKYTSSGLIHGDSLGGSLGRAAGENVGSYAINQGSLAHSNYSITFTGNQLQITPKALTVTADAASKVYGDADDLKYTSSGLIHGDSLGGSLGRAAGENVGSYAINQGSLAHSNYSITFTGNQLQITPKALSVTADAASKVYGDADDLKYTSSGLIHGDSLGGSLGRAAGENVGSYAINQGSLANSNYSISFTGNQLQITPKALSVTADAASKVYGDVDDLKYTSSGLIHGDRLGGSLGRAAGENVGSYAINQGSLANSNYSISFTGNQLQITPKVLSVTADAASKVYGDVDDLKYTSSGLIHGDRLGGSLGRAAGENVGSYAINQGSLANSNYSITFTGNQLQITPKALSVTADAASKVYGDVDDLKYTSSGLIHGDRLGGSLGRAAGENVGSYAINQGSLANSNYSITFTGNQLQITPKALSVTADAASKVYGDVDDLKYTSSGLIHGDSLGGSLGRAAGENVGSYAINQGSLANSNYSITFTGDQLQITPKALTITAGNAQKTAGQSLVFQGHEFTTQGLVGAEQIQSVQLDSAGATASAAAGSYAIVASHLRAGAGFDARNYDIRYVDGQLQVQAQAQAQRTTLGVGDLWRLYSPHLMQQPGPQVPPTQKKPLLTIEPEHIQMAAI